MIARHCSKSPCFGRHLKHNTNATEWGLVRGSFLLNRHAGYVRTLTASAAIAIAVALAGCQTNELAQIPGRAMQPLPRETVALIEKKNMTLEAPVLVRIYKEESELEVWKQDNSGRFARLKTYPICRWSGALGPKKKQGDRQAPEGFYTITPGQMNPKSNYYLAFNLGFPNAYDRAHGYSGAFLMVHGDCSSSGCYSMTDEQMAEIYALAREAFLGGQKSFQVQALPFRMTALNMARHRNNPSMAFWRMLKEGTDQFEVTRQEPRVDVCGSHYAFGRTEGAGGCAGRVPYAIEAAVRAKQDEDNRTFAALVNRGMPTVAVNTGSDGGMHPIFVAQLQPHTLIDTTGRPAAYTKPGSGLPKLVRLPRALDPDTTSSIGGYPRLTQIASADPSSPVGVAQSTQGGSSSGNFFSRLFHSSRQPSEPAKREKEAAKKESSRTAAAKRRPHPRSRPQTSVAKADTKAAPARRSANAEAPAKTELPGTATAYASTTRSAATTPQTMSGARPVLSSSNFDNRWGGLR